jgi:dihydrofolate synthase/folylpolyglutamate synthase
VNGTEALAWLYATQQHGVKPGLKNIHRLLHALGVDGNAGRFLHVAGTNGKGSVCALLDAICRAAGIRTGLYTSPHLVSFRERIRLNGAMIPETAMTRGLNQIRALVSEWEPHPTFFEITTALALDYFERERAEIVVLETGMGGRFDATNAVTPAVSVLTAISLDHMAWLGPTIGAISREKAGIIKPGVPVVAAPQVEQAARVLRKTAREKGSVIEFVTEPVAEDWPVGLAGSHQKLNAALAIAALRAAHIEAPETAIREGLRQVAWPGRFQTIHPPQSGGCVILDGAHNEAAARRLAQTWRELFGREKAAIVLGVLKDKNAEAVCAALAPIASRVVAVPVRSERTLAAEALGAVVQKAMPGVPWEIAAGLEPALAAAGSAGRKILVTGSLFLVGEVLAHFDPAAQKPAFTSQ